MTRSEPLRKQKRAPLSFARSAESLISKFYPCCHGSDANSWPESTGRGRAFIAGDAAHLTSPTGGFGMNTGLLDAVNLSWKLAAMIHGWGGRNLLASCEAEQYPVAVRNVGEASENLRRMLSPRVLRPEPAVFDTDAPDMGSARREYGQRYTEMMRREWFSIGVHLGYVYEGSPIRGYPTARRVQSSKCQRTRQRHGPAPAHLTFGLRKASQFLIYLAADLCCCALRTTRRISVQSTQPRKSWACRSKSSRFVIPKPHNLRASAGSCTA
ncbi:FAD-dependent monooxygenase [Cupriavidus basilensis]